MNDSNNYTIAFHFVKGSLSGRDLAALLDVGIGFKPTHIHAKPACGQNGRCNLKDRLCIIANVEAFQRLELKKQAKHHGAPRFDYCCLPYFDAIFLSLPHDDLPSIRDFFSHFVKLPGFTAGYIHDSYDTYWQNERLGCNYEQAGISYDHLPTENVPPFIFVDTRPNPGHRIDLPGMRLTAAWRMWFSPLSDYFLSTKRLHDFKDAHIVEDVGDGIVFVELYEDGLRYGEASSRAKQIAFRKHIGFDDLADQAPRLLTGMSDPVYQIHHGNFDSESAIILVTWLNERKEHVVRSKANQRWMSMRKRNGEEIWSCIENQPFSEISFGPAPPDQASRPNHE